ncbi:non-ribosomal peptide synthetase [Paenibacillus daejeonensis]|uniref:non-ribosomal peptide synthetase n=1 Tax=Paenibacillus daejeonensis TaxID=135193 RepID=UPI00035FD1CD|nr:non-ribosomal peptide synthetase [Paenibacillus daejeonensis]
MNHTQNQKAGALKPKSIDKAAVQDMLALTPMQEGILLHELKEPGQALYHVQFVVRLEGMLDLERFQDAWNQVAASSDMLRTVFRYEGLSQPVQIVLKRHEPKISSHDYSDAADPESRLAELRAEEQERGFDLSEPPYRILLCKLSEQQHAMLICNHHILYDGWSTGLLLSRFFAAYGNKGQELQADPAPFKAYVQKLQQQDAEAGDTYWHTYLEDLEETTRLPYGGEEAIPAAEPVAAVLELSREETDRLGAAAREQRVTLAALLFAGWGLLLQRYGLTRDAVFGTTVSGRSSALPGIESMIGLFINTVPLRVRTTEDSTVGELLQQVAADLRARAAYESMPLSRIQKAGPEPGESLFDSIVVVENYPVEPGAMRAADGSLSVSGYELEEATHYALTLGVMTGERLELTLGSPSERYDKRSVTRILAHYRQLLLSLTAQPEAPIAELAMVSSEERSGLLGEEVQPADTTGTIDGRFAEQVRRTPQAIAVKSADGEWTYEALDRQADHIAHALRSGRLAAEEIVALQMRPSQFIPAAMLGILRAGGAYLPIHPEEAPERISHMLGECRVRIVLADQAAAAELSVPPGVQVLDVEALVQDSRGLGSSDAEVQHAGFTAENQLPREQVAASAMDIDTDSGPSSTGRLAYVMYTSGSTGKPKGVMVEHGSVINIATWFAGRYALGDSTAVLQLTDYTFDPSVEDWFGTLLHGGKVVIAEPGLVLDKAAFRKRLVDEAITLVNYVPSILGELLLGEDEPPAPQLRTVICGGEPMPPAVKDGLLAEGYAVYNNYGPTETTVDALSAACDDSPVHLGEPVAGMRAYVLGLDGEPVPAGATGELYLAGPGVARGYIGDAERTAERFGEDPYRPGIRMYRSGDLVRRDREGRLRFAGRRDEQVKIRGYRVEPGETEAALAADVAVEAAAVVAVRHAGRTELHGFVSLREEAGQTDHSNREVTQSAAGSQADNRLEELRQRLRTTLPAYMIPSHLWQVPELPLTRTGKLDRRELRRQAMAAMDSRTPAEDRVQPGSEIEQRVWQIWSDVLGREDFGVTDDFFAIGGDSHRLIRIYSLLGKAYPGRATVQDLFDYRSVSALAAKLSQADQEQETPAETLREIEF